MGYIWVIYGMIRWFRLWFSILSIVFDVFSLRHGCTIYGSEYYVYLWIHSSDIF